MKQLIVMDQLWHLVRYPPAALPSPSMGRAAELKTHGTASSYGPMLGAR